MTAVCDFDVSGATVYVRHTFLHAELSSSDDSESDECEPATLRSAVRAKTMPSDVFVFRQDAPFPPTTSREQSRRTNFNFVVEQALFVEDVSETEDEDDAWEHEVRTPAAIVRHLTRDSFDSPAALGCSERPCFCVVTEGCKQSEVAGKDEPAPATWSASQASSVGQQHGPRMVGAHSPQPQPQHHAQPQLSPVAPPQEERQAHEPPAAQPQPQQHQHQRCQQQHGGSCTWPMQQQQLPRSQQQQGQPQQGQQGRQHQQQPVQQREQQGHQWQQQQQQLQQEQQQRQQQQQQKQRQQQRLQEQQLPQRRQQQQEHHKRDQELQLEHLRMQGGPATSVPMAVAAAIFAAGLALPMSQLLPLAVVSSPPAEAGPAREPAARAEEPRAPESATVEPWDAGRTRGCPRQQFSRVWGREEKRPGAGADVAITRHSQATATSGETRTTVMMRNLPNNYTRDNLLRLIDSRGFSGRYDFLYFPVDFRTRAALGYAFINLVTPCNAIAFRRVFDGFSAWRVPSKKVCCATWSDPHQGLEAHIARYRNSPLMHHSVPAAYRPILFSRGQPVAFPSPTRKIKPPRQGTELMLL